ncbi:MAG: ABC transporter ATP-binding protein [Thermoprotei archaeon]
MLETQDLSVGYKTRRGLLWAIENVNLRVHRGEVHALVGESGCGKSTLGLSLSRLLPSSQVVYRGKIMFKGVDLACLKESEVQRYRGSGIATIFQEPLTSLNPVMKVGEQIAESLAMRSWKMYTSERYDQGDAKHVLGFNKNILLLTRARSLYIKHKDKVHELLSKVGIQDTLRVANMYPHELSGGMNQRVMIAMAIAQKPDLLVADEPTTALDVTTQVQILRLIGSLVREYGMSVLLITHDLGVVSAVANRVSVMYAGRIVEEATCNKLIENPLHPYTRGLIASFPRSTKDKDTLNPIPGTVPPLGMYPLGCRFHTRCPNVFEKCRSVEPSLINIQGESVACHLYA